MNYSMLDLVSMIADPARTGAYARALRKMVTPESVVLDLGAGFGFFAVLAAKLGARRVYAVERNDAIGLCPALARANGVADRVTTFHGDSRRVVLPERANLLIEDVRGILPLHVERVKLLQDARERLLTPDARFVAVRDRIWAAPARHQPAVRAEFEAATGADTFGVDLRPLRAHVEDGARRIRSNAGDLLLPGALLGTLDLATLREPDFEGTAHWTPEVQIVADGFEVWFDATLAEGESFSAQPGPGQTVHGCLYLPLRAPLTVPPRAQLSLRFRGIQSSQDYVWAWECAVTGEAGGEPVRTPRQSTLSTIGLTRTRLASMSEGHQPSLGTEGRRWRDAVALVDGQRTAREIADALGHSPGLHLADSDEAFVWLQRALVDLESGDVTQL